VKKYTKGNVQDRNSLIGYSKLTPYLFSAPAIVAVTALLAFPVIYAFYGSLFRAEFLGAPPEFVGLENYKDLLGDPAFLHALTRTAIFVLGCLVLGTFLALLFAFALNRAVHRLRFFRAITIAPYIVSSVAAAVMFRIFFNREFGQLNQVIEFFGIDGLPWLTDQTLAMVVVILAQVWTDLPLAVLLLLGGLQTIDPSYLDAAEVDGATGWKRARFVSIPLIAPQLAISTVWLSYATLTSLGVVLALTRGGPRKATQTLPVEMYETGFIRFETAEALAIAIVILILNAVLTLGYIAMARRYQVEH
jgi:ABC-type sugar transport system permease subunit